MDSRLLFGLGVSVVGLFLRWRFPAVPKDLATFGGLIGLGLVGWALVPSAPWPYAVAAIVALATIGALLDMILSRKEPKPTSPAPSIDESVTSHNQSGGITARNVNSSDDERR